MKKNFNIDTLMILSFLSISIIGVFSIYSSIFFNENMIASSFHIRQIIWIASGIVLCIITASLPPQFYYKIAYPLYGFILVILLVLAIKGGGVARWISIGGFRFQPSEFAKIVIIIALAKFLSTKRLATSDFSHFLRNSVIAFFIVAVPGLLILKQPDLGTSIVVFAMLPFFLYWQGVTLFELFLFFSPLISTILSVVSIFSYRMWIPWLIYFIILSLLIIYVYIPMRPKAKIMGYIIIIANVLMGIITPQVWDSLKPYQQNRIVTFINPTSDPFGAGYQVIQSKIAISSGGFWGKGWLEGSQTKLNYLPEQHTDFIFSSFAEQFGFIGSFLVIFLFFIIVYRLIKSTVKMRNPFVNLLRLGFASYIVLHVLINVGMTVGIMPVTGLPLILMSYGGSVTMSAFILFGVILSSQIYSQEDAED